MKLSTRMVVLGGRKLWTPAALGSSLALWLDADDFSTITLNGSTVSQWRDKSGNGRNASQATAANQPTYSINEVRFNASAGTPRFLSISSIVLPQPFCFYFVGRASPGATIQYLFDGITQRVSSWVNWPVESRITLWAGDAGGGANGNTGLTVTSNEFVGALNFENSFGDAFLNGTQGNTVPVGSNTLNGMRLGTSHNASWAFGYTFVREIVVINQAMNLNTRQKIEGYLAWKWGLTANLSIDHPFKFTPPIA